MDKIALSLEELKALAEAGATDPKPEVFIPEWSPFDAEIEALSQAESSSQSEQPFAAPHILREKVAHIEAIDRQVDSVAPRPVVDVRIETSRIRNPDRV
jgi:hypothetical protein